MSSRAAASRKRLAPREDPRSSPTQGYFIRSKNVPPLVSPHSPNSEQIIVSSDTSSLNDSVPSFNSRISSQIPDPYHVDFQYAASDATADKRFHASNFSASASSVSTLYSSPYPSPLHTSDDEYIAPQTVRFNGRPLREASAGHYEGVTYIEASYQPPPPIHASSQPPPPHALHTVNYSGTHSPRKPARILSSNAENNYALQTQARPHANIGLALSSPLSSPAQPSTLLRRLSPTPTEPPTYSSVHEVPYSTPTAAVQAIYESSPHSPHTIPSVGSGSSHHFYDSPTYIIMSSPSQQLQIPTRPPLSPESARSMPNELDIYQVGRDVNNGSGVSGQLSPAFLNSGRDPHSPGDTHTVGPPGSLSSSDSGYTPSGKSAKSSSPSTFVFPGSRSVARPKASKKARDKLEAKSRGQQGSDPALSSPSPTNAALPSKVWPQAYASTQNPPYVYPESPTSGSENSGSRSPRNGVAIATSDPRLSPPTPAKMVYPGGRSRAQPSKPPKVKPPRPQKPSSSAGEHGPEGRSKKFMDLLKRKKNGKQAELANEFEVAWLSRLALSDVSGNNEGIGDARTSISMAQEYGDGLLNPGAQEGVRTKHINLRIGTYPLDPYDTVLLDNDRHTGELLARLNPTNSPCFYNYGNHPPTSVLDLGCGQGYWVVDAAIAWKGYGTTVTGYDMADLSQRLLPWVAQQGVTESVRFVQGNFLTHRLPFSDSSFDLVRMSCLTLCIPSESWLSVLKEVCRVLMVGGRLEVIDDAIFFPYGKVSSFTEHPQTQSAPPRLNISIPSSSFTTFSIYDGETTNPGLGPCDSDEDDFFDATEDEDIDDTATLNGRDLKPPSSNSRANSALRRNRSPGLSVPAWDRAHATAGDVEALFEHMLTNKFGINKHLPDFILELMQGAFGHAREVKTMHLVLAPPNGGVEDNVRLGLGRHKYVARRASLGTTGLSGSPGLILWPSTFIPMEQSEIEIHASKHLRMLLSHRDFLLEHALEATDDAEIDEESVEEALWQYESFLRSRFDPPSASAVSDEYPSNPDFDVASIRGSIAESITSNNCAEMWEIHSEFIQRYTWQRSPSSASSSNSSATPTISSRTGSISRTSSVPSPPLFTTGPASHPTANSSSATEDSLTAMPPPESQDELTHVRTFRIYEAVKMDPSLFGGAT